MKGILMTVAISAGVFVVGTVAVNKIPAIKSALS